MAEFNKWLILGDEYYYKEEFDKSIEAYNHALEFDMESVEIWNNLGHAYSNKALKMEINSDADYKEVTNILEIAIQKYHQALVFDPKNIEAWYNIGQKNYFIAKYEKSIDAYKEALKLDPEDFEIWIDLADAYASEGKRREQHHALQKALALNSKDHNIWQKLGRFYYYVEKNYNKAKEAFNESLKINPKEGDTWAFLGRVYREMGENKKAINLYKKAIEIEPNNSMYKQYLGLGYNRAKDYKNAIITFKNILDKNPKRGLVWNYLAISYSIARDYDNAIKAFEQSLKCNYKILFVWNNLVKTYLILENYDKVIELCENIFKIKWDTRDIIYKKGIPQTYNFLSLAYKHIGKNVESLEASNHAKELSQIFNNREEVIKENLNHSNWKTVLNYSNKYSNKRIYEKEIEETIVKNPEILEDGLKLIGSQYKTSIGFIDILFKDQEDNLVVVELKRGKGRDKVVGQIQRYMAWVDENLTQGRSVRGIIVVKRIDNNLLYAVKGSKFPIEVVAFKNEPPIKNNIKYCDKCGTVNRKSARFCSRCQNKFWMK